MASKKTILRPIRGPQEQFLRSPCDVAIYGGGAGGGKSYALFLESLRHINKPGYTAIIFRRSRPEITGPGGLWETSKTIFPGLGLNPRAGSALDWTHPKTKAVIKFSHLYGAEDHFNHKGGQYAFIGFDELTSFLEEQFVYMASRNRPAGGCNVRGLIRATTNPDNDSWVLDWIAPWVVPSHPLYGRIKYGEALWYRRFEPSYIDPEVVPYIIHRADEGERGDQMVWVAPGCPKARSITYIPSSVYDNPYFADGAYESAIMSLSHVERIRLLGQHPQCWLIKHASGNVFNRSWFKIVEPEQRQALEGRIIRIVRAWDFASSQGKGDYTVGTKIGLTSHGEYIVMDVRRGRWSASEVERNVKECAELDGRNVSIIIEEEKGAAGKNLIQAYRTLLSGYRVISAPVTGSKIVRSRKASAKAEQGKIYVYQAIWTQEYLNEHDAYPTGKHDDQVDTTAHAVNALIEVTPRVNNGKQKARRQNFMSMAASM